MLVYRHAVADEVQIVVRKIDDFFAVRSLDPGLANVPLPGNRPVEHRGARRHLMNVNRQLCANAVKRCPNTIAGYAAADGVELLGQRIHRGARPRVEQSRQYVALLTHISQEAVLRESGPGIVHPSRVQPTFPP